MLDYFKKNMAHLAERGAKKSVIKYTILEDGYYHKFYRDEGNICRYLATGNDDQLVTAINKTCNNLIKEYHAWPDIGAVYLKCKQVEFVYFLNSVQLINKFPHTDAYLEYVLTNIVAFSREIYPSLFDDWLPWNVAIQEDLSWIVVDLEEMFHKPREHFTKDDFITVVIYKLARDAGRMDSINTTQYVSRQGAQLDPEYVTDYIRQYFRTRPKILDFIK